MAKAADRLDEIFAELDHLREEIANLPHVDTIGVPTDDADEQTVEVWEKLNA